MRAGTSGDPEPGKAGVRRSLWMLVLVAAGWTLPTLAYETLQKTAEVVGPRTALLRLSCDAEAGVPWRPRTGVGWFDHTVHELAEARLFWRLARNGARSPASSASGPPPHPPVAPWPAQTFPSRSFSVAGNSSSSAR